MLQARIELGVRADDVRTVTIKLATPTFRHNGWVLERPATELQAQINIAYAAAVALLDGAAYPAQFRPDRIDSDDLWDLLDRTTVVHDSEMDTTPGLARGTRIEIALVDGTVHRLEVANALGTKRKPMSNEQVRAKFRFRDDRRRDPFPGRRDRAARAHAPVVERHRPAAGRAPRAGRPGFRLNRSVRLNRGTRPNRSFRLSRSVRSGRRPPGAGWRGCGPVRCRRVRPG